MTKNYKKYIEFIVLLKPEVKNSYNRFLLNATISDLGDFSTII